MAGSIIRAHFNKSYEPIGVFASAAAYLSALRKSSAEEGMTYYDTTLNQLRTYDGTNWSAAGLNSQSAGSMNDGASIGSKITIDGSTVSSGVEIEASVGGLASGALLLLDNNDTTNDPTCIDIDNAANAAGAISIDIDSTAGYDIYGTGTTWNVDYQGNLMVNAVWVKDDKDIELGTATNGHVRMLFHDGSVGTDTNGLLFDALGADEQIVFGDATYSFDVWFVGKAATTNFMKWDIDGGAGSVGALVFANADIDLGDNDLIRLGGSQDFTIGYDSAKLVFTPAAGDDDIAFGASGTGCTVNIYGTTANRYLSWASAYDRLVFQSDASSSDVVCQFNDHTQLTFGIGANFGSTGSGDVQVEWDSANFNLTATDADTPWKIGGTAAGFDITYYFETSGTIATDYDAQVLTFDAADLRLGDDDYLLLGDSATAGGTTDGTIRWDNTNSVIEVIGATNFEQAATFASITVTGTFAHSGAYAPSSLTLGDNEPINFGDSTDVVVDYDTATGDLQINGAAANQGIDFGGATTVDVRLTGASYDAQWDANRDTLLFQDSAVLGFGGTNDSAADYTISTAGSTAALIITAVTADDCVEIGDETIATDFKIFNTTAAKDAFHFDDSAAIIYIGESDKGTDMKWWSETAANSILWDMDGVSNAGALVFTNSVASFNDGTKILLGTGSSNAGDFSISGTSTPTLLIEQVSSTSGTIEIGVDAEGIDTKFFGDNAGDYMLWDQNLSTNGGLAFRDTLIQYQDGTDTFTLGPVASNAFTVEFGTANRTLKFGATNNMDIDIYGNTATNYVQFNTDDSALDVVLDGFAIIFQDAASSMTIGPNASNSLPIEGGAANDVVTIGATTNTDVIIHGGTATHYVEFDTDDSALDVTLDGFDIVFQDATTSMTFGPNASNVFPIEGGAANDTIQIGNTTNVDLGVYGTTNTNYWLIDTDDSSLQVEYRNFGLIFEDGSSSMKLGPFASNILPIEAGTANDTIKIGATTNADVCIYGGTSTTINAVAFTGSGLDDCASGGTFTGNATLDYKVEIDGAGTPDTFKWSDDGGSTWDATTVAVTGSAQTLNNGVTVTFTATTGHTATDYWAFAATINCVKFDTDDSALDMVLSRFALLFDDGVSAITFGPVASNSIPLGSSVDDDELVIGNGTQRFNLRIDNAGQAGADIIFDASGDTNAGTWSFGADNLGVNVLFYGASANKVVTWDQSADAWYFGANSEGVDVTFYGDTAASDIVWTAASDGLLVKDSASIFLGNTAGSPDQQIKPDGTNVDWDINSGVLTIGDGGTTNYASISAAGTVTLTGTAQLASYRAKVAAKTSNYSVTAADSGTYFTNYGATAAVNFTLPAKATGLVYNFIVAADYSVTVTADAIDTMVCFNDAAADSVALATASQMLGGGFKVICDGNLWYALPFNYGDGVLTQTITIAT